MLRLFKNKKSQHKFENDGYITTQLLNYNDITELLRFYIRLDKTYVNNRVFHSTTFNKDPNYSKVIVSKLKDFIVPKIDKIIENYRVIIGGFIVKEPSSNGIIPPHQDWTFVNEEKYYSINIWIPLQDVDINNGTLGIIDGSQDMFKSIRGSPNPQFKTALGQINMDLFPFLNIKSLKAGEAIIYDTKIIHGSTANLTNDSRVAVGLCLTSETADLYHWYLSPEKNSNTIIKYKVDENFFSTYNNDKLYSYYLTKKYPNQFAEKIDEKKLASRFLDPRDIIKKITSIKSNQWNEKLANLIEDITPEKFGLRPDLQS